MTSILLIDDNAKDVDRARQLLTDLDLSIEVCSSARAAHVRLMDVNRPIDLALVKWDLRSENGPPGVIGPELLLQIRQRYPGLRVIVVSDIFEFTRIFRGTKHFGAREVLIKPLDRDQLRRAVLAALAQTPPSDLFDHLRKKVIGESRVLLEALDEFARAIPDRNTNVLLIGESGTGKELLARAVHEYRSAPKDNEPWVALNVSEIPESLAEAKLFGAEKGSYTGAITAQIGVFEETGSGTLFLDEIGELPALLQAKLLRVVAEREFRRIGGSTVLKFSGRVVCATNRNLTVESQQGKFRSDLYYRFAGTTVRLPPLRDRGDDRWLLIDHFLEKSAQERNGKKVGLSRETRSTLTGYPFPGNIRELAGIINHALLQLQGDGDVLLPRHLPLESMYERSVGMASTVETSSVDSERWPEELFGLPLAAANAQIVNDFNRVYLQRCLDRGGGKISQAARLADVDPKTFRSKWKAAGLKPLEKSDDELAGE